MVELNILWDVQHKSQQACPDHPANHRLTVALVWPRGKGCVLQRRCELDAALPQLVSIQPGQTRAGSAVLDHTVGVLLLRPINALVINPVLNLAVPSI